MGKMLPDAAFCRRCGTLRSNACPHCFNIYAPDAIFCRKCGRFREKQAIKEGMKKGVMTKKAKDKLAMQKKRLTEQFLRMGAPEGLSMQKCFDYMERHHIEVKEKDEIIEVFNRIAEKYSKHIEESKGMNKTPSVRKCDADVQIDVDTFLSIANGT